MRAAVQRRYGGPEAVSVEEVPTPHPAAGELLVRVHASAITPPHLAGLRGSPRFARLFFGLARPKHPIAGNDFAGTVEAVGGGASRFAVGDRVFGTTPGASGTHAEYLAIAENASIALIPADVSDTDAAAMVDASAMSFLHDTARLNAGQTILIRGASGGVGSVAVQLAKATGATVVGVCSTANLDWVRSLGADEVIDYTRDDYARAASRYDVIFDVAGGESYRRVKHSLTPSGVFMTTVPAVGILFRMPFARRGRRRGLVAFTGLRNTAAKQRDLLETADLLQRGVLRPVVSSVFPLERVSAAYELIEAGKRGIVVLSMEAQ